MRSDTAALYDQLHGGLTDRHLEAMLDNDGGRQTALQCLVDFPGVSQLLRLKAYLSDQLLGEFRATMTEVGGADWELTPSAFPPPWSFVSGLDFRRVARHCDALSVKLYGMHWAMMLRFYGDQLLAHNGGLSERLLAQVLVRLLDIADDGGLPAVSDYRYPDPDEPHPAGRQAQLRKIAYAQRAAGDTPIHVLAHGYGPTDDFRSRLRTAWDASEHGLWLNRYGYLSDAKLAALAELTGAT